MLPVTHDQASEFASRSVTKAVHRRRLCTDTNLGCSCTNMQAQVVLHSPTEKRSSQLNTKQKQISKQLSSPQAWNTYLSFGLGYKHVPPHHLANNIARGMRLFLKEHCMRNAIVCQEHCMGYVREDLRYTRAIHYYYYCHVKGIA